MHIISFTDVFPGNIYPIHSFEVRAFKLDPDNDGDKEAVISLHVTDEEAIGFAVYAQDDNNQGHWVADCPDRESAEKLAESLVDICKRYVK